MTLMRSNGEAPGTSFTAQIEPSGSLGDFSRQTYRQAVFDAVESGVSAENVEVSTFQEWRILIFRLPALYDSGTRWLFSRLD